MKMLPSLSGRVYLITNTIMILIYAGAGILILLGQFPGISPSYRKIFGGIMLLYAGYRGFSLYRKSKERSDEN